MRNNHVDLAETPPRGSFTCSRRVPYDRLCTASLLPLCVHCHRRRRHALSVYGMRARGAGPVSALAVAVKTSWRGHHDLQASRGQRTAAPQARHGPSRWSSLNWSAAHRGLGAGLGLSMREARSSHCHGSRDDPECRGHRSDRPKVSKAFVRGHCCIVRVRSLSLSRRRLPVRVHWVLLRRAHRPAPPRAQGVHPRARCMVPVL